MSAPLRFETILIANRGEIACRVIQSCRRLGLESVAVYSEADANARHVRLADRALGIGPAPARESYLRMDRIIEAALRSGAQAIHPGYGFLSENPEFAEQCARAGLIFIGPPVAAMRAMSSKATAKRLMEQAGVPVLPGYHGEEQDAARLRREAERIGYPVLIKATAGGGGKGMRVVEEPTQFDDALAACQREARSSFADERVLIEKYLPRPRHVEVQVFGDSQGRLIHLHERDCSAQRRHQKLLEEAPAPGLGAAQRAALTRAALSAAAAVQYVGAGTVEFLLAPSGDFFFLEMNTRIQVEHPVTEMITGVDLVAWQLQIAAGSPLPLEQAQIECKGHAIEVRLYAETPESGFLPATGTLRHFELPAASAALRLETGVAAGDTVGIDYDPLLAKLIVHAGTRALALAALGAALAQVRIAGINNNLLFLRRLVDSAPLSSGPIDTGFIEREGELLVSSAPPPDALALAAAALWTLRAEQSALAQPSPWVQSDGWRLNGVLRRRLQFELAATPYAALRERLLTVLVDYESQAPQLWIDGVRLQGALHSEGGSDFRLQLADQSLRLQIEPEAGSALRIVIGTEECRLRRFEPPPTGAEGAQGAAAPGAAAAALCAPMPGRILAHLSAIGAPVDKGAALLIMEAMKMEHVLRAPAAGSVRAFLAAVGEQVAEGAKLIEFEQRS
jgi:3-methylcrotonyl-CoA carboxylase alpha subunit